MIDSGKIPAVGNSPASHKLKHREPGDLVWGFDQPHRVGSVCGPGCEQCAHTGETRTKGPNEELLPNIPLFIEADATFEDWKQSNLARGGPGRQSRETVRYYYFVTTD